MGTTENSALPKILPAGLTVGSDFFATNPPSGAYGSKSNITVAPTGVNLQSEGADMSGANDAATAWANAQTDLPSGGGEIYVPPGVVKTNNISTVNDGSKIIVVRGAGMDLTTLKGSTAVDHVFSLRTSGAVRDLTVDGGAITTHGLTYTTNAGVNLDHMELARVRCTNTATGASGWVFVAVGITNGTPELKNVYLTDSIFDGPSSNSLDAFATSIVDTVWAKNLLFRNLYRSPNFYNGNKLIADGIIVTGITHSYGLVVDAGINDAQITNLWVDATSAAIAMNALHVLLTNPHLYTATQVNVGNQAMEFVMTGGRVTQGITMMNKSLKHFKMTGVDVIPATNQTTGVINDNGTGGDIFNNIDISGCLFDLALSSKWIGSPNGTTWDNSKIENNRVLVNPTIYNLTLGTNMVLRNNPGYNPIGVVTPGVPASTVAVPAVYYDRDFYITTGAGATTIAIQNGPTITLQASVAGQFVHVPAGKTMTPTYANPPTWVVEGK